MAIERVSNVEEAPFHLLLETDSGMEEQYDLLVLEWRGREEVSAPYSYWVTVATADASRDMDQILGKRATLRSRHANGDTYCAGVVDRVRRTGRHEEWLLYEIELAPNFRVLTQTIHRTHIHLGAEQTVRDIVTEILQEVGMVLNEDFRFELDQTYQPREFVVQYQESLLNFVQRLLERDGISFFFEHNEEREVMVITDHGAWMRVSPSREEPHYYIQEIENVVTNDEFVTDLTYTTNPVPASVVLSDYNYRRDELSLKVEHPINVSHARGVHYEYGLHAQSQAEASRLAQVVAEGFVCRQRVYTGDSTIRSARAGHSFALKVAKAEGDPLEGEYVITAVHHTGDQTEAVFGFTERGRAPTYENRFEAIRANVPFRPERATRIPRIPGMLTGVVESAGGEFPDIDDQGRYAIRFHYDRSDRGQAKATHRIRMMQPHVGPNEGMHFPLHQGSEVAAMFMDGDPDRPVIAGALPNPTCSSPVKEDNKSSNVLTTHSGNRVALEDDGPKISLSSPTKSTSLVLGASDPEGASLSTEGQIKARAKEDINVESETGLVMIQAKKYFTATADENDAVVQSFNGVMHAVGKTEARLSGEEKARVQSSGGPVQIDASTEVKAHVGESHFVQVDGGQVKVQAGDGTTITLSGSGIEIKTGSAVTVSGSEIKLNC